MTDYVTRKEYEASQAELEKVQKELEGLAKRVKELSGMQGTLGSIDGKLSVGQSESSGEVAYPHEEVVEGIVKKVITVMYEAGEGIRENLEAYQKYEQYVDRVAETLRHELSAALREEREVDFASFKKALKTSIYEGAGERVATLLETHQTDVLEPSRSSINNGIEQIQQYTAYAREHADRAAGYANLLEGEIDLAAEERKRMQKEFETSQKASEEQAETVRKAQQTMEEAVQKELEGLPQAVEEAVKKASKELSTQSSEKE